MERLLQEFLHAKNHEVTPLAILTQKNFSDCLLQGVNIALNSNKEEISAHILDPDTFIFASF